MKKNIVITIERQYGSGGRTVGKMLAEELGIHYYDKELVRLASDDSGISEELFTECDERLRNQGFNMLRKEIYHDQLIPPGSPDFVSPENLFNYQAKAIKDLAKGDSCIIIGRAADYVLQDFDNVVSVFVHAPHWFLMQEAAKKNSLRDKELEKFIAREDKFRSSYYEHYTGRKWFDANNYELCLDCSKLGFDKCVEAIKAYCRVRFGEDVFD